MAGVAAGSALPELLEARPSNDACRLTSALDGSPVLGELRAGGRTLSAGRDGMIPLRGQLFPWSIVEVRAEGHYLRRTCLRDAGELRLWPVNDAVPRRYVRDLVYGETGRLVRPMADEVVIVTHGSVGEHDVCQRTARAAAEQAEDVLGLRFRFETPDAAPPRSVDRPRVDIVVDPADPALRGGARAAFYRRVQDATVTGGRIVLSSCRVAHDERTLMHELGHLFFWHSPDPMDLMSVDNVLGGRSPGFSERERLVLRLMRERMPGNTVEDDDRALGPKPTAVALGRLTHRIVYARALATAEVRTGLTQTAEGRGHAVVCSA